MESQTSKTSELFEGCGAHALVRDKNQGSFKKYKSIVIGDGGVFTFLKYELITCLFGSFPGAFGLWLRQKIYPCLFHTCGSGIVFGRNMTLRHPGRIRLGNYIVFCDDVTLDAKGTVGEGITIKDSVFIGKGTFISTIDGTLEIEDGANIGTYCRVATRQYTRIGKKALLAGYCYIVGAGHETIRTDIPILDQPSISKGGASVGDGCWLGTKVSVMDGVTIGHDSIIGAHSLVTKDLPDYCIALGIPAKVVKMRKE